MHYLLVGHEILITTFEGSSRQGLRHQSLRLAEKRSLEINQVDRQQNATNQNEFQTRNEM